MRTGHAALQADAKSTEIRRRPRLCLEPLQSGTQSLKSTQFQTEPRRRSRRVASTRRGIRGSHPALVETSSNWSGSTRDVPSNGGVQSDLAPFAKRLPRLVGRFSMVIKSGATARTFRQPDLPDWPMFDRLPVFLVGQRVNTHRVNILRRQAITSRQKGVICDAG